MAFKNMLGGDGLTDAVIINPASSTRNVIQPTGDYKALVIKNNAGQTVNIFEHHDSAGNVQLAIELDGELQIPQDSKAIKLGAGLDMTIYYTGTVGVIKTDNIAASDLEVQCGADKTLVLTEVVWDDMRITPGSFDRPGISDPSIWTYAPGGGALSTYLYQFAKNNLVSFTVQLPHSYKQGEDISVHVHWTPGTRGNEENGKTVGWKVDYTWANIDGTFGAMATADLSDACDGTDHKHQMTPSVTIGGAGGGAGKNISSMLLCNLKRTDTGIDDTWVGTLDGELPLLLEVDFHFPIDTMGSRQVGVK